MYLPRPRVGKVSGGSPRLTMTHGPSLSAIHFRHPSDMGLRSTNAHLRKHKVDTSRSRCIITLLANTETLKITLR